MQLNFKLILFLLFPVFLFSQHTIRLKVVDEASASVPRAIVIISQDGNQIAFGTTDTNGFLENQLASGTYTITIKKLGFVPITEVVFVQKEEFLTFTLLPETNQLKNVIITSRPKIMKVKGDTISYNLKAVVDGTENKIEDVIKKLPGLDIDQNGKVLYKGQQIDNVLVNGNEFFGNKHQMATQNINADMIEGIDLLTNYAGFATASGGKKGIALNLKTKDSYKNKWIMDFDAAAGINNSFRFHSNSFKFFKKGNVAVISDYNTIAKTPISREDYNEMRILADVDSENGEFKSIETPTFLNPNAFIKDKKNAFIGLNYTSLIGKRSKITFANVFNKAIITEENDKLQTNVGEPQSQFSFLENKVATYSLNNSAFKWEFNKSKSTFISYVAGFTPNADEDEQDLLRSGNVLSYTKRDSNFNFAHIAKVQTTLFKVVNYKGTAQHSADDNRQKVDLFSQQNLFGGTFDTIHQNQNQRQANFSFNNVFTRTLKNNNFSFKINLLSQQDRLRTVILENQNNGLDVKLQRKSIQTNFSWLKNWDPKFQSILGFKTSAVNSWFQGTQNAFTRYEPNLSLIYNFKGLNKLTFNYSLDHQLPSLSQLQQTDIIVDFQTISKATSIDYNRIIPKNSFSLQYFSVNPRSQSVLYSTVSYDVEQNSVSSNTIYNSDYIENVGITTRNRKSIKALALYDLKLHHLPFSIKTTLFYLKSIGLSRFNSVDNEVETQNFTNRLQLVSNFRKSHVQFGIDYNFIQRMVMQSSSNFNNTSQNHQITLSIRGKSKTNLKWDIGFVIDDQDSGFDTNQLFFLNANVQYMAAKNWKLFFNGNNMLNLNQTTLLLNTTNASFFTASRVSIRPGYLMLGLNYSL
ncbi:carboxypeptidase-like regulatory domain-containing protein [Flavobacterium sandaracinum]|uniref:Carboxypeptidase regulatory-like domain-containing protein n=1 Tax=Flavobacterium sandaracinum TaxID=2541733 RepID=A0A4R5D4C7_9FLAO|nr:carboxypeptidase-like regulatory domain-containing protein [Flavobacterium sandaracinum]TDE05195.1 carboxypeptidase regulatory-like domain-containing protein [Flavobacterium sandaracinum]